MIYNLRIQKNKAKYKKQGEELRNYIEEYLYPKSEIENRNQSSQIIYPKLGIS